jgi:diguanylate cyclase (GGDEF)-like protein
MDQPLPRVSTTRAATLLACVAIDSAIIGALLASAVPGPAAVVVLLVATGLLTGIGARILLRRRAVSDDTAPIGPTGTLEPGLAFSGRFARALDRTTSTDETRAVLGDALARSGAATAELLLAPQPESPLEVVAGTGTSRICPVSTADACPAISTGRAIAQDGTDELDACPHLRSRDESHLSALCVPVFVGGTALGVVHSVADADEEIDPDVLVHLESYALHAGPRLSPFVGDQTEDILDPLTGLINRRSADKRIRLLVEQLTPFTVAVADLDSMELINEQHGHEAGDRVIRLFSEILTQTLRPDDVVSRYGGDEFVVLFPHTSTLDVSSALERVRERLALRLTEGDVTPFTASFGVADSNQADGIEELVLTADDALLLAKKNGRNRVVIAGEETYRELFEEPGRQ